MRRTARQTTKTAKKAKLDEEHDEKSKESSEEEETQVKSKYIDTEPEPIKILALDPDDITSVGDFQAKFDAIAENLMNSYILDINGKPHRLSEIEFYLQDDNHPDTFTHCDELQKTHGKWYFHKVGKGYKGGSYKGLDITFATRGYGGILIRAISDLSTGEYIEGPSMVVDRVLTLNRTKSGIPEIAQLVEFDNFNLEVDVKGLLFLRPTTQLETASLCKSGRVGLVLRTEGGVPYCLKPYRYMNCPAKVRKGRQHLILELHHEGKEEGAIVKTTGATKASVAKYIASYEKSKASPKTAQQYFAQKLKTDEFSEFYHVLRVAAQ